MSHTGCHCMDCRLSVLEKIVDELLTEAHARRTEPKPLKHVSEVVKDLNQAAVGQTSVPLPIKPDYDFTGTWRTDKGQLVEIYTSVLDANRGEVSWLGRIPGNIDTFYFTHMGICYSHPDLGKLMKRKRGAEDKEF